VKHGEVVGIIGRNGAGKSTLLKVLARITEPTEGHAEIRGRVGSLLEVGTGFHPELSGRENIFLNGAILGMKKAEILRKFDEIVAFAEIEKFIDTPVKHYSSGMYVRLAFAVAAHMETEILVIDEVLAVGDAQFQKKCLGKMGDAAKCGRTVLFVSHQLPMVENLCQIGIQLEGGRVTSIGPARDTIAAYANGCATQGGHSFLESVHRRGNGVLRLEEVHFFDDRGAPLNVLVCGKTAVLELRLRNVLNKVLHNLHIDIGVDNALGQRTTTLSTSYVGGDFFETPAEGFAVQVRLPRLALMPGTYTYNLFVTINGEIADWLLPAGSFSVEAGDYYGSGQLPSNRDGVFLTEHFFELVQLEASMKRFAECLANPPCST
jgi:lipopolysaccharide transport system ATP-binding protein